MRFSRRLAREHTGWSDYALRRHLVRLIDLELVVVHRRANAFAYQLVWDPDTAGYDRDRATIARVARDRSQA